jgi:hypothetical protein
MPEKNSPFDFASFFHIDKPCEELKRMEEDLARATNWKRWGPYLSDRQWGTVREDYSADGDAWNSFSHEDAMSRAYRWGEDGLLGICDRECRLCFGLALWNGKDPILKERLYGLTNSQGNHGEDVKELYYYLDSTPSHSYMKALYKYPQNAFPYEQLLEENKKRGLYKTEYEILDTGLFDKNEYFDVFTEYAKEGADDILIKITISNRSSSPAYLRVLPTLWFRNTWSWGATHEGATLVKPRIERIDRNKLECHHPTLGEFHFVAQPQSGEEGSRFLFTDNESNTERLWKVPNQHPYVKDAFHEYVVNGKTDVVNPEFKGTKVAVDYDLNFQPEETKTIILRLYSPLNELEGEPLGVSFDSVFKKRLDEANEYYGYLLYKTLTPEERNVQRQCLASLLWTKQFYHYAVKNWLEGDPAPPPPPEGHKHVRNFNWENMFCRDVISMPDKWEYPWFAAWDLAFHMIPFSRVDPHFAKRQLMLMMREWYMHPNGQIPAYEWKFDDVNPPVHAWACWRVYKMTGVRGERDIDFLQECFLKLLLNFTWWVNRKDPEGRNLFSGGFLGLDNIGAFDRSKPLPGNAQLHQADGTAWMAFFCSTMLSMAVELAHVCPAYEGIASKFFEHFISITDAINSFGGTGLWNEEEGFYYDIIDFDTHSFPLKIRSLVGLIPLLAVEVLDNNVIQKLPHFKKRMDWFFRYRSDVTTTISCMMASGSNRDKLLLAIPTEDRLRRVLRYVLDESEFLGKYGIRSISKYHENHPYVFEACGERHVVHYTPGESDNYMFGGNSNWRGPIWMPINFLLIEALEKYHYFYGDGFKVEFPTGSGNYLSLNQVADKIGQRLINMFLPDNDNNRPVNNGQKLYQNDPHFKDLVLFYEYFHGDSGKGLGASHQTGWTALVSKLLEGVAKSRLNNSK